MPRISHILLRTTDPAAARAFYEALLVDGCPDVAELPAAAVARGAKPHWLGHVAVEDPAALVAALVTRGAQPLGLPLTSRGASAVVLRERGGAVFAVGGPSDAAAMRADVAWHLMWSHAPEQSLSDHIELFGWHATRVIDTKAYGIHREFAWSAGGPSVGAVADVAAIAGVHPQWLHVFTVPDLERAIASVRAQGGLVIGPATMPNGARMAACDDPQGGAFGLTDAATLAA